MYACVYYINRSAYIIGKRTIYKEVAMKDFSRRKKTFGASYFDVLFTIALTILLVDKPNLASCGSILIYMPLVAKSQKIAFMPVAEEMAARGHEVVVLAPFPAVEPNPKIKEIILECDELIKSMEVAHDKLLTSAVDASYPAISRSELINTGLLVSI